ncbi:Rossmann-fold NAD(P)-binding domain-containing protein [Candidatus Trichorickettsia mobilis]|uniref:hypothetical protein n=1 Tax=Candidatus Trichorickettsia mobilis TaxID=1346319 RepID=UPI00292F165A|nr:hypothetical protein [Candidatus Trichorickettsia mobilis]
MKIFALKEIKQAINFTADLEELIRSHKSAFIDFASGLYEVPPPMQFVFPNYGSDCHIKGGYKQGSNNLVIKIANGSPFGGNGVILVFAADTGVPKVILYDEGFLTGVRTAIVGIIVSEWIPWRLKNIGIIGSGNLGTMLYDLLRIKYPTSNIMLYARDQSKARNITDSVCDSIEKLVTKCDVIFTATSSTNPIIHDINKDSNKAIIAFGSDDTHKSELSVDVFAKSDLVIVDSKEQAMKLGDVAKAIGDLALSP